VTTDKLEIRYGNALFIVSGWGRALFNQTDRRCTSFAVGARVVLRRCTRVHCVADALYVHCMERVSAPLRVRPIKPAYVDNWTDGRTVI